MRDIEWTLSQGIQAKKRTKSAYLRLKDLVQDTTLKAVSYDRIGSSSSSTSSPVEKQVLLIMDARHDLDQAVCRQIDAAAAVTDLICLLDDPEEIDLLIKLFLSGQSTRLTADHLRISYKTLLNRKANALDHLEELVKTNEYAAQLAETLKNINNNIESGSRNHGTR